MAIPVNIDDLIYGRKVEGPRLEYKTGWNPEKILHTICAFANDIDDWGGGYVIVGVEYTSSIPNVIGLDRSSIDSMMNELVFMSNLIEPRLLPSADVAEVDGKAVMVIWAPTGDRRPYSCPVNYSKGTCSGERGYYIRKMASTIRANKDDERRLFETSRNMDFDICINRDSTVDELRISLVAEFLYRVGSALHPRVFKEPPGRIYDEMRIVGGPKEDRRPLNIGMMFFNDRPDEFFRGAFVDVVYKPEPGGDGMTESRFKGPLDRQLIDALAFIDSRFLVERVYKSQDRVEAIRIRNYPMEAIRELLVNAVYHKSYEIAEPVTVTVTPTSIEILNYPGPSTQLSDEDIRNNDLSVGPYRNKRIGEYLKELDLAESRFTGIPKVVQSLETNGSPPLRILTDPERTYFRAIVGIHPDFLKDVEFDRSDLGSAILGILGTHGCMSMLDLCKALGYKGVTKTVRNKVSELMDEGSVSYLYPDSPRSPKQRICLRQ